MAVSESKAATPADLVTYARGRLLFRVIVDKAMGWVLLLAFVAVLFPLADMIYWISAKALPTFSVGTLTLDQVGTGGGLHSMIIGTFIILALSTTIAVGIGVLSGIYTAEFAPRRVAAAARVAGYLLAGVPAIVLGYFGFYLLVIYTGWDYNTLAGGITLGIFMVPFIYRATDLAFTNVPRDQREGALAMGASRFQYLRRVALPIAMPTMLSGIFLAMALGLGETAPLVLTVGWSNTIPQTLLQPTGYLTGAIWNFYDFPSTYGHFQTLAFQAAFLLIVIVIVLNVLIQFIAERYRRKLRGLLG
jgi:phosphate transport system permease protein